MYKQRFRYNKMIKNVYKRKKQLDWIEKMWQKTQIKKYFYDLEQFSLKCIIVYYCCLLDVDRLMLINIHQQFDDAFTKNIKKLSYTVNELDVYELFIIDEITKHITIAKSSTILHLFKTIKQKCKLLNFEDFYIIINKQVINYEQTHLMKQKLSTFNIKSFDNVYVHHRLKGGGKINVKRNKSGKYEEDDSDADSDLYEPPLKKRKQNNANNNNKKKKLRRKIQTDNGYDNNHNHRCLTDHNINEFDIQDYDVYNECLTNVDGTNITDLDIHDIQSGNEFNTIIENLDTNDDVANLTENTIIYEYNSKETLTLNDDDAENDNNDETENKTRFRGKQYKRKKKKRNS